MKKSSISCILFSASIFALSVSIHAQDSLTILDNSGQIEVLNFATFHMAGSTDAVDVEFDQTDDQIKLEVNKIAELISNFRPTIICVEVLPSQNDQLNVEYQQYLERDDTYSTYRGEIGMIAFEVGRKCGVEQLYGIDEEMSYDYEIAYRIKNDLDSNAIQDFYSNPLMYYPSLAVDETKLSTLERLRIANTQACLDFMMLINAEMLTHVGSEDGFEGADEAAKFYHRNLRMYANLNRIPMSAEYRIFVLTGGTHTAFLGEFMRRSPKYKLVDPLLYLSPE